jgi:hypothetical protein
MLPAPPLGGCGGQGCETSGLSVARAAATVPGMIGSDLANRESAGEPFRLTSPKRCVIRSSP